MSFLIRVLSCLFTIVMLLGSQTFAATPVKIPILCYHNFNPKIPGSMTITPQKFEAQLQWLLQHGYTVIPLKEAVAYLQGTRSQLPAKPVVITADDGWQSQYTYLYPIVKKYNIPVTLFIYPGTISEGKNTMTWDELKQLQQTGLFDIESHTYSHPNFKQLQRRMSATKYERFVQKELLTSKQILEAKLNTSITLLAWPFGIYNAYLENQAKKAGYTMAFSIDHRRAAMGDNPMSQPRFMIVEPQSTSSFAAIMK